MKLGKDYNLAVCNPQLAEEWHPTKNGSLTPKDVTAGSDKKVWWRCSKNEKHPPWQATINHRSNGCGCLYCSGRRVCNDNCLQTVNPRLAKEWHPTKNGNLLPKDVTPYSNKKAWWQCRKNKEHPPWQAVISDRNNGYGCCRNCKSLQTVNPKLAKEWHPTNNGSLTPNDVTTGSDKKVW